ncbi:SCO family protein [Aliikangiella coralliicola]|uniref:SCO family protein n=1 Tax=Aliikangiella coralliicola TaxID=2592383 RepID=A0A545U7W2_9GAMM|nr:SCO family protein [Aliikangiella coralliicola]TQV85551.1 SCO family protein [Aliikangiella coralliicola]
MNITKKVTLSFLVMALVLFSISAVLLQSPEKKAPVINGVVIPKAKSLNQFSMIDHRNNIFNNQQLEGRWHLVSYGYTHCPDICPNTLNILAGVVEKLESENKADDLKVLFYSIDPKRDTVSHLAEYIPFFHKDFIGLTYVDEMQESAQAFEQSLGMISVLTPIENSDVNPVYESYTVSHGVMLYLLNPQGNLQAVFKPEKGEGGVQHFTVQKIYADYLAVRNYFG